MARQTNTPPAAVAGVGFMLPVDASQAAQPEIGGKARSLARLAALGLPVPPGFAIAPAIFSRALRASRGASPAWPARLRTAADLQALEAAEQTLRTAPFPDGFEDALGQALAALAAVAVSEAGKPRAGAPVRAPAPTFAVRSSGATEDRGQALAAGVYCSRLRVGAAGVPAAIRDVLASYVSPAAWAYHARTAADGPTNGGGTLDEIPVQGAVLVHLFVEGDAWGTAAAVTGTSPDGVRIESSGALGPSARARIQAAVTCAAAAHGPVELEWVASGETVTFLQLRPYRAVASTGTYPEAPASEEAATNSDPWIWDAAHNPLPLSPAQAGLVQLVDSRCDTGIRQRVVHGYLFYRHTAPPTAASHGATGNCANGDAAELRGMFELLRADLDPRLGTWASGGPRAPDPAPAAALPRYPPMEAPLDLFVSGYEPLFGTIAPACAAARKAFWDFLYQHLPARLSDLPALLGGVPSIASERRAAFAALVAATRNPGRDGQQDALDEYMRRFGDETPRWDVAEPTWRETPQRLLLLAAAAAAAPPDQPAASVGTAIASSATSDASERMAAQVRAELPPSDRARFDRLLAAARTAVAVGEDDDGLYARLQAIVRRALIATGEALVAAGLLDQTDDVFYLPLDIARAIAANQGPPRASAGGNSAPPPREQITASLRQLAAAGRRAFSDSLATPPPATGAGATSSGRLIVRGVGGAGGRFIGRAIHHPPAVPLGPDAVLIAPTLLPTELPLLAPGALVVETGNSLGHVAAQARERGLPAVVGAAGAMTRIPEGALIAVDGDRGEVVLLESDEAPSSHR